MHSNGLWAQIFVFAHMLCPAVALTFDYQIPKSN